MQSSTHKTAWKMPGLKLDLPPRFRLYATHPQVGRLAQLVEHCVHIAGVTGSSPVSPTIH